MLFKKNKTSTCIKKQSVKKVQKAFNLFFVNLFFFHIKLLHANVQCVYTVYSKCQIISAKAEVQVDFPQYALSMHQQNSYIKNCKGQ